MSTKLTPGEFDALNTILRNGGKVLSTMGRMRTFEKHKVRTSVLNRLSERGLVRPWTQLTGVRPGGSQFATWMSGEWSDIAVTAEGCQAFHNEQGRRTLKAG